MQAVRPAPHGCVCHALRCDPSRCIHACTWTHRDGSHRNACKTHPCRAGVRDRVRWVTSALAVISWPGLHVVRDNATTALMRSVEQSRPCPATWDTLLRHWLGSPVTFLWERGRFSPRLSRELMITERWARRRSKALDETHLNHTLNLSRWNHVSHVKVTRQRRILRAFRLRSERP